MTLPPELIPLVGEKCEHEQHVHDGYDGGCIESTGNPEVWGGYCHFLSNCPGYTISQSRVDALVALVDAARDAIPAWEASEWQIYGEWGLATDPGYGEMPDELEALRRCLTTLTNQEDATP